MAFSKEQIEYLHNTGKMPDWAYYQQNGGSAQENYNRQIQAFRNRILERYQYEQQEKEIEKQIEDKLEEILEDLLKDLNFDIILK